MEYPSEQTYIWEKFKDIVIAEEGKTIILDCKLTDECLGQWYKDSALISSTSKTKISSEGLWQILEIRSVNKSDEGIYCFAVNSMEYVYSKCMLFVKPHAYDNVTHYLRGNLKKGAGVSLNLRSVNTKGREDFCLTAKFSTRLVKCEWFKNNCIVPLSYPRMLLCLNGTTQMGLLFNRPKRTDSGTYCLVAQTYNNRYLCSYADILVDSDYTKDLYNNVLRPRLLEGPEKFFEVFDHDNVRLIYKVAYDHYTIIEWTKDGTEVTFNDRIKCETYYNRHIALTIRDVTEADSGQYYLILRHKLSTRAESSATRLHVKCYESRPAPCFVSTRLKSTVASVGNGVTFRAQFRIPEPKYNYVVWNVGHYKIEKSCSIFKVMIDGDEFILHIPVVTPEMNGEICCQLRQYIPPQQSILLCTTTSYLAVVPPATMRSLSHLELLAKEKTIYSNLPISLMVSGSNSGRGSSSRRKSSRNGIIMKFTFCRMSGGNYFFDVVNKDKGPAKTVNVERKTDHDPYALFPTPGDCTISWVTPDTKVWYAFDVCQANGEYSEIGLSHFSQLDIKEPPEDKLFKFRVRRLQLTKKRTNKKLCYVPEELQVKKFTRSREVLPFQEYTQEYSEGINIGCGSFGPVDLVYSRDGKAVVSETSIPSTNEELCEWNKKLDILKSLSHPNIISINDCYLKNGNNGHIVTMDYLWGGELKEKSIIRQKLTEADIIVYIRQILLALQFIHSKQIAHLDINPENIICVNRNSRAIKLINFGMAKDVRQPTILSTVNNTDYVPPEIIQREFIGTYCDMWSLGVLTYWILTGRLPFLGYSWAKQSDNICNVLYKYDDAACRLITDRAKEFVSRLLRREPRERMTAVMALNNCWITRGPNLRRPRDIPIQGRGGVVLVHVRTHAEKVVAVTFFIILAIIKFKILRQRLVQASNPNPGGHRYSERLTARRTNERKRTIMPYQLRKRRN